MPYAPRLIRPQDSFLFDSLGNLVGLQSGASDTRVLFPGSYSFSIGELSAAKCSGIAARFSGVGPSGNIVMVSDGTNWRPQNGRAVLYQSGATNLAAPAATLTGSGATQYFSLSTPMRLPLGLLYAGAKLRIEVLGQKAGTHTGVWRVGLATAADGTGYTQIATLTSNAATASFVRGTAEAVCVSGGFLATGPGSTLGAMGTSTSASTADRTFATMLTADAYVVIGIESSYTDSAANLVHYALSLEG